MVRLENLLLLVPAVLAGFNPSDVITHVVPYWTDDAGYCKKLPGLGEKVHRAKGLDRLHIKKGDKVSFTYSTHHDIWAHPTLEALESCNYSEATLIANKTQGGGCENEADLECMAAATPFVMQPGSDGMLFLSCSVSDHCVNGQRLVIEVHSSRLPPPAEVTVPLWTDDAGYCKPIPGVFPVEQHHGTHGLRPHGADREGGGLEPITIAFGQSLVFKYSTKHDVWQHPSAESLTACRYSDAHMLADTSQGGGCTIDEDLACIDASVGFKLTPTRAQVGTKLYLSCSVGDHCTNGQTLVVTVVDGAGGDADASDANAASAATPAQGAQGEPGPMGPAGPAGSDSGAAMLFVGMLTGAVVAGVAAWAWSTKSKGFGSKGGGSDDPRHAHPAA